MTNLTLKAVWSAYRIEVVADAFETRIFPVSKKEKVLPGLFGARRDAPCFWYNQI